MNINGIDIDIISLSLAGSHLYGTNTPSSDVDIRGVCFSPIEKLLGLDGFEQYDFKTETSIEAFAQIETNDFGSMRTIYVSDDVTIYSLQKFAKLCLDSNPNIVELLFTRVKKSLLDYDTPWLDIIKNRKYFLSQKARHTFSGYAFSQLKRIKTYTKWMEKAPEKPDPTEFGITQTDEGGYLWTNSNLKNQYDNRLKEFQNYSEWITNRNPKRKELEERYGYDTKHGSHLARLILEGMELLETGKITLPLKDEIRKVVCDIRDGKWEYGRLLEESEKGFNFLKNVYSDLPNKPDRNKVNKLIISMELERMNQNELKR